MKFSENIDKYKERLIKLREDLNKTLEKGQLDENFEEKLLELEKRESKILKELLPYYRQLAPEIYPTKVDEIPVKASGTFKLSTYLKSYLCIDQNIFILASAAQKVQFMRISEDNYKIELSQPIKNFNKLIVYMSALSLDKILLFAVTGDIFMFQSNDFEGIIENIKNLKKYKLGKINQGFENVIKIEENKFLCQIGANEFLVLKIDPMNLSFEIKKRIDLSKTAQEVNSLAKINDSYLGLGSNRGELLLAKYKEDELIIDKKIKTLDSPINYLTSLENEKLEKNICLGLGDKKNFFLYDLDSEKILNLENQNFKGNIYNIESKKGSAIVLTDDFYLYLLEENMGKWTLNQEFSTSDRYYVNVIALSSSNYFTIDLNGDFQILKIDRLDSIEKLRNIDLISHRRL